ncbi:hypothetical protein PV04_07637 [Phialophora macrospora]|uniref:Transcription factor domain-containing protein n=1 Tax=Phialophora macrospora TaxID=1851006 RepID=A0A0D2CJF4_9EURO|nr:hypothetical protein PV04_07637 [Phialophora macrospora]
MKQGRRSHHQNHGECLKFINVSHPEESKQKNNQDAIRHHVMTRVADSRRKRPQTWTLVLKTPEAHLGDVSSTESRAQDLGIHQNPGSQWNGEVPRALHPYSIFPVDTDSRARQLIQFMHVEGDYLYRPFRNEWWAMAVVDCTAFYLSLANAALFFHQRTLNKGSEYSDFEESSKYLSLCLNQVTTRLNQGPDNVGEGVITTVLGFLCHDSTTGRWDRYAMHMDGLQNILRLRGDFHRLKSTIVMFVSWFDVLGSSMFDKKPRFPMPPGFATSTFHQVVLSTSLQGLVLRLSRGSDEDANIAIALQAGGQVAMFVNQNAHSPRFWKDGAAAARRITPVMHLLLSLPRPAEFDAAGNMSPKNTLLELVRLALLIMSTRLKKAFSLVSDELDTFLERFSILVRNAPCVDNRFPELSLWASIIVASMERSDPWRKVHVGAISTLMGSMGIQSGEDAVVCAKQLVWLDALMDSGSIHLQSEINSAGPSSPAPQKAPHFIEPVAPLHAA